MPPMVRPERVESWRQFLTGLWLSGLRLSEGLALSWDEGAPFAVDLTGKHPVFRIYCQAQKARRDETVPMTPDFAQFLAATPEAERVGPVFKLACQRGGKPIGPGKVGAMVSRIGKKAGVVVNKADGKFASAHDLRRSFGTRWAKRIMPAVLKRLMRHAAIQTTMGYYVDLDAAEVADQLWASYGNTPAAGNTLGNTGPKEATAETTEKSVSKSNATR